MTQNARIGDTSTHGGQIISGAGTLVVEGQHLARIGDILMCPDDGPSPIVTGSSQVLVEGSPVARIGDVCACGAVIVSGAAKLVTG